MTRPYRHILWILAALVCLSTAGQVGADDEMPEPSPRPTIPNSPHDARRMAKAWELVQAALEAGGCADASVIDRHRVNFEKFCDRVRADAETESVPRRQAELLFEAMHKQFLAGEFQDHCYRLDATLEGRSHNCLTSSILFLALCRASGLPVRAMAGPTHVYCRLDLEKPLDVQTTSPGGFSSPVSDTCQTVAAWQVLGLSDRQLLARVHYNRGTYLLVQREPSRAAKFLYKAWELDPQNAEIRHNLLTARNDWSLQLCDEGRFSESVAVLQSCESLDPDDPTTLGNDVHVHHCWIMSLCARRRFAEALELVEKCAARRPDVPFYDVGRWVVCRAWAASRFDEGDWAGAADVFARTRGRHPDSGALERAEVAFWTDCLARLKGSGRHRAASRLDHWRQTGSICLTPPEP